MFQSRRFWFSYRLKVEDGGAGAGAEEQSEGDDDDEGIITAELVLKGIIFGESIKRFLSFLQLFQLFLVLAKKRNTLVKKSGVHD